MTVKVATGRLFVAGLLAVVSTQAADLFYSSTDSGNLSWDIEPCWIIYNSGSQHYNALPTTNDNVMINATTPKAENGNSLTVTNGVFAECNYFASGHQNFAGTAWFRLDGGSLTCRTHFVTGEAYPGLSTLESGNLYGGGDFSIGNLSGGYGTVTNNGATVNCDNFILANDTAASPSALVQTNGSLTSRGIWYVGYRGDALMEIHGGSVFSANNFDIGYASGSSGTLMLNDGSVQSVGAFLVGSESGSSGTLIVNGGSITGNSYAMIGRYGRGLAELNAGTFQCAGNLYIGDYTGSMGVVTNNGADLSSGAEVRMGYSAGAYGKLVHNSGTLDAGTYLQVGQGGGNGEFEASAPFGATVMIIGAGLAPTVPGTGTVTLAEGAIGAVDQFLRVNNGDLYMRGGEIHLRNTGSTLTNLYVRTGEDRRGLIRGWGYVGYTNENVTLRMINNGQIVADGEGVDRDLDLNMIAVVNNEIPNGFTGTNGWYAVNKGCVRYPRTWQNFSPGTAYCWGDLWSKAVPEMVNSVGLTFTASVNCAVRGALCASDRSDIPAGLPAHLRPLGVWKIGGFADRQSLNKVSFAGISLTFRYDHTKVGANDSSLRLYRYDGSAWVRVGSCLPGGDPLISTDTVLAPVAYGDYNIGWFAVMAVERNGTLISVY